MKNPAIDDSILDIINNHKMCEDEDSDCQDIINKWSCYCHNPEAGLCPFIHN